MYRITLEIEQLPEGPYLGTSRQLPGLIVQAETADEVVALAPHIARDLISVMLETGEPLPETLETLETLNTPMQLPILVPVPA